jgi:hypothetical protein
MAVPEPPLIFVDESDCHKLQTRPGIIRENPMFRFIIMQPRTFHTDLPIDRSL